MEINWLETMSLTQSSSLSTSPARSNGFAPGLGGDSISLSQQARETQTSEAASWLNVKNQEQEDGRDPVQVLQQAVAETMGYLQDRLEQLIGGLDDEGRFDGGLAGEMQALAQKLQAAQDQGDGARALRLLRSQSGKLAEVLAPELTAIKTDTSGYFRRPWPRPPAPCASSTPRTSVSATISSVW